MRIQWEVPVLAEGSCRSATPVFKGMQIGPSLKLQEEKREGEDDAGNTQICVAVSQLDTIFFTDLKDKHNLIIGTQEV